MEAYLIQNNKTNQEEPMSFIQSLCKATVFVVVLSIYIDVTGYEYTFEIPVIGVAVGTWLSIELIKIAKNNETV